jgi:hypothetical protein
VETDPPETGEIADNAVRCLSFLYRTEGVFAPATEEAFKLDASFDVLASTGIGDPGTGYANAVADDMTDIYLLLASVRQIWFNDRQRLGSGSLDRVEFGRRATEYVLALHRGLLRWSSVTDDAKSKLHDPSHRTEMFRRIPGLLELAEQLVILPLRLRGKGIPDAGSHDPSVPADGTGSAMPPSAPETDITETPRRSAVARIVNHLNCFGRYYTGEFLQFLHEWTGVAAVVELIASLPNPVDRALIDLLDFERSFVDGTTWVVPFAEVIDAQAAVDAFLQDGSDVTALKEFETETAVRMPSNGVHLEAAPGRCVLPGLPNDSAGWPVPVASSVDFGFPSG